MIALIDGDILTYRIGFTTQEEETWVADARINELLDNIMAATGADKYRIFLTSTDKSNFRYNIYPEYKANRKADKPKHYQHIREYLEYELDAEVIYGEEADDALGYSQTEGSVICSIDKDLLMIPGRHYNFVKQELYMISPEEGRLNFYSQLLNGDIVDNIPGCPGIGPKKIEKLLHVDMSEQEMASVVYDLYYTQYLKKNRGRLNCFSSDMHRNGILLKIKQNKNEPLWSLPIVD